MASTQLPVTVQTVESNAQSWLKQHEVLIITFLVLILGAFTVYKYFDLASVVENHKAQVDQAALTAQTQQNDATLTQAKQTLAADQAMVAQTIAENSALSTAIASRDKTVVIQQAADAKLQPTQLATRWQSLIADSGVEPSTTGYIVSDSFAITNVEQLEQLPALQQDL